MKDDSGKIKAIETEYNGYRFRSRLEARWAVFFDSLGIEYQYEPEGFELKNGVWYLPDFYIPHWKKYIEIKPSHKDLAEDEFIKAGGLAQYGDTTVLLIKGNPWPGEYAIACFTSSYHKVKDKIVCSISAPHIFAHGKTTTEMYLLSLKEEVVKPSSFYPLSQEFYGYFEEDSDEVMQKGASMWILTREEVERGKTPLLSDIENEGIEWVVKIDNKVENTPLVLAYKKARKARFGKDGRG